MYSSPQHHSSNIKIEDLYDSNIMRKPINTAKLQQPLCCSNFQLAPINGFSLESDYYENYFLTPQKISYNFAKVRFTLGPIHYCKCNFLSHFSFVFLCSSQTLRHTRTQKLQDFMVQFSQLSFQQSCQCNSENCLIQALVCTSMRPNFIKNSRNFFYSSNFHLIPQLQRTFVIQIITD